MKIAIAGFHGENSSFSMHRADEKFFITTRGEEMLADYDFDARLGDVIKDVEWLPTVRAMGASAGPIPLELFRAVYAETEARLREVGPVDGVYLDLHGAEYVLGQQRPAETFVRMVRDIVGPEPIISASMDTHGNFSEELASMLDLACCHRQAPHQDRAWTTERAIINLVKTIERGERPFKAWVRVPVLLPGERTSTLVEPGRTIFGSLESHLDGDRVLDANLWVGFAWADEDRNSAAAMATGYDRAAVLAAAETIARSYWDARDDFGLTIEDNGSWEEAIAFVEAGAPRPVLVSDAGDNVRAGGSGDTTYAMAKTIEHLVATGDTSTQWLFAGMVDPESYETALAAGVGAELDLSVGAKVDFRYAQPVVRRWTVEAIVPGLFGEGPVGVLLRSENISVIVHWRIAPFIGPNDATSMPIPWIGAINWDVSAYDAVVVKNGYQFPSQLALVSSSFMATTPGGTDLDFDRLEFRQVWRPIFPLDRDFEPDLGARILTHPINQTKD